MIGSTTLRISAIAEEQTAEWLSPSADDYYLMRTAQGHFNTATAHAHTLEAIGAIDTTVGRFASSERESRGRPKALSTNSTPLISSLP